MWNLRVIPDNNNNNNSWFLVKVSPAQSVKLESYIRQLERQGISRVCWSWWSCWSWCWWSSWSSLALTSVNGDRDHDGDGLIWIFYLVFDFWFHHWQVKMFIVITMAYLIFWGPLFIVTLANYTDDWKAAKKSMAHEVRNTTFSFLHSSMFYKTYSFWLHISMILCLIFIALGESKWSLLGFIFKFWLFEKPAYWQLPL